MVNNPLLQLPGFPPPPLLHSPQQQGGGSSVCGRRRRQKGASRAHARRSQGSSGRQGWRRGRWQRSAAAVGATPGAEGQVGAGCLASCGAAQTARVDRPHGMGMHPAQLMPSPCSSADALTHAACFLVAAARHTEPTKACTCTECCPNPVLPSLPCFCSFRPGAATWNTDEPGAPGTAPMPAQRKVRSLSVGWLSWRQQRSLLVVFSGLDGKAPHTDPMPAHKEAGIM